MRLNQRITIQRRVQTKDGLGQATEAWEQVDEVWADVEPLAGREFFAAQQAQSEITVRMTIRYRADITASMRVLWRGQPHEIKGPPLDVKGRRQWLQLMCAAGVGDGR